MVFGQYPCGKQDIKRNVWAALSSKQANEQTANEGVKRNNLMQNSNSTILFTILKHRLCYGISR
jgi:hypothetical protein